MPQADIEDVIAAAKRHGGDVEPGYEVRDLQEALRLAWEFMRADERADFMTHDTVKDILANNPIVADVFEAHPAWKVAHSHESGMYYLTRQIGKLLGRVEVWRDDTGEPGVFFTKLKAQRVANKLNEEG